MGEYYADRVEKVLKNEVFKSFKFYKEKRGKFKINYVKYYNVDELVLTKNSIIPDFFVHKIEVKKFKELLENRKYMMRTFQELNTNKKYISVIGEIKISQNYVFKNNNQRKDYIKFIQNANSTEEELVLMYVYDESYKLFKEVSPKNEDKIFLILCYIPRLFLDDCYKAYNNIIKELKLNINEIDLNKKPNEIKLNKEELINELKEELNASKEELKASKEELNASKEELNASKEELNASKEELKASKEESKKRKKKEIYVGGIGITIVLLIFAFLIQKINSLKKI